MFLVQIPDANHGAGIFTSIVAYKYGVNGGKSSSTMVRIWVWEFPQVGEPKLAGWLIFMENPIDMADLGDPLFRKPSSQGLCNSTISCGWYFTIVAHWYWDEPSQASLEYEESHTQPEGPEVWWCLFLSGINHQQSPNSWGRKRPEDHFWAPFWETHECWLWDEWPFA